VAEMRRVMIAAGRSYLQSQLEEPISSDAPQIVNDTINTLLPATNVQPMQGSPSQEHRPATSPTTPLAPKLPQPEVVLTLVAILPSEAPSPQQPATRPQAHDDVQHVPPVTPPPRAIQPALAISPVATPEVPDLAAPPPL
jgi:hypothetical protein